MMLVSRARIVLLTLLSAVFWKVFRRLHRYAQRWRYSYAEWQQRCKLAACYRLAAKLGWDEVIYNHITARVPGEDTLLINGFGLRHDEITASNLVKIDMRGNVVDAGSRDIRVANLAGLVIHTAVHEVRHDVDCIIHHHRPSVVAAASLLQDIPPTSQVATIIAPCVSPNKHTYEGVATDEAEKKRLQDNLGHHDILLMKNHGVLVCGKTIEEAWWKAYMHDNACEHAVVHLAAAGGDVSRLESVSPAVVEQTKQRLAKFQEGKPLLGVLEFAAARRGLSGTPYEE